MVALSARELVAALVKTSDALAPPVEAPPSHHVPAILLEGDAPSLPPAAVQNARASMEETTLPEAYGTGKVLLAAREPHWLYVWWDLSAQQQRGYNARSATGHLVVRIYGGDRLDQPVTEAPVHPESRHWFVHVNRAGTDYAAELGYYAVRQQWVSISTSRPTRTPPDAASADQTLVFATIRPETPLAQPASIVPETVPANLPFTEAAQERALADMVALYTEQPADANSAALPALPGGGEAALLAEAGAAPSSLEEAVSSPMGPTEQAAGGFWFSVNADIVVYGATEPDASVTIGGQSVPLREDGTFSCRFALPDGEHAVMVSAMSAQGELRQAKLQFTRHTGHQGQVGSTPQDPTLVPPS